MLTQVNTSTIGDIYEASIESDRDKYENVQIFDTPGVVSGMLRVDDVISYVCMIISCTSQIAWS